MSALAPTPTPVAIAAEASSSGASEDAGDRLSLLDRASRSGGATGLADALAEAAAADEPVVDVPVAEPPVVEPEPLPDGVDEIDFAAGLLSTTVPDAASGVYVVVPGEVPAPGAGTVKSVRIEVEEGLDIDPVKFADQVMATLNDPRSWGGDGSQTFARTAGEPTFTVTLASPRSVDRLCAPLETIGLMSCGLQGRAVLNHLRWVTGSGTHEGDMTSYRAYLVNHEVGHVLGNRHQKCASPTALASVMVQQSGPSIACVPNGWPFP